VKPARGQSISFLEIAVITPSPQHERGQQLTA
jgi:hypothetical protein